MIRGTSGGQPGYKRLFKWPWTPLDLVIGAGIYFITPLPLMEAAGTLLLPVVGLFIALSFA